MNFKEILIKNLPHKLISLLLAVGLFYYVGNRKSSDRIIDIPLDVRNQPNFLVPIEKLRYSIPVKISGLRHKITLVEAYQINAFVDMSAAKIGDNSFFVTLRQSGVPADVAITSSVKRVKVKMDWLQQKYILLQPRIVNRPARNYSIKRMSLTPDKVLVAGPSSVLKKTQRLYIRPVNISGIRRDLERVVEPDFSGSNLFLKQPQKVVLKIEVGETLLRREYKKVPVMISGLTPGLKMVGGHSFFVRVVYTGTRKELAKINANRILFAVDLSRYKKPGEYKITVQKNTNAGVTIEKIVPANITVKLVKE